MPNKQPIIRNVALCYVRISYSRLEKDFKSAERQRANIQAILEERGWVGEWFEDVGGHKSARSNENRPEWLKLRARLRDNDVVAIVANEISRLYRNQAHMKNLMTELTVRKIELVFATQDLDITTFKGYEEASLYALADEMFAENVIVQVKDSIRYRKKLGVTVGIAPFGTVRDSDGYLIPSPEGFWLLPDGTFQQGDAESLPSNDAIWRSYYDCARYVLELYVEGKLGTEKLAYQLTDEGWAFRDRNGKPRPIHRDDVRRIVGYWQEYGGIVREEKSQDRSPLSDTIDLNNIPFVEERAVFPIELLIKVALIRSQRSWDKPRENQPPRVYALSNLVYCLHCQKLAVQYSNPRIESRLSGWVGTDQVPRYRHKSGVKCGISNRTVHCATLEADIGRLIRLLEINQERLNELIQNSQESKEIDNFFEAKLTQAIKQYKQKINTAVVLFMDMNISQWEYERCVRANEREIRYWQSLKSYNEQIYSSLTRCLDSINHIGVVWEASNAQARKEMASHLFEHILYNLDTQQITGFQLKPWAAEFLVLQEQLYED